MSDPWTELIKSSGPSIGGLLLFAWGGFGGQYAAKFKSPFDDYASGICVTMMAAGFTLSSIQTMVTAYKASQATTVKSPSNQPRVVSRKLME